MRRTFNADGLIVYSDGHYDEADTNASQFAPPVP